MKIGNEFHSKRFLLVSHLVEHGQRLRYASEFKTEIASIRHCSSIVEPLPAFHASDEPASQSVWPGESQSGRSSQFRSCRLLACLPGSAWPLRCTRQSNLTRPAVAHSNFECIRWMPNFGFESAQNRLPNLEFLASAAALETSSDSRCLTNF